MTVSVTFFRTDHSKKKSHDKVTDQALVAKMSPRMHWSHHLFEHHLWLSQLSTWRSHGFCFSQIFVLFCDILQHWLQNIKFRFIFQVPSHQSHHRLRCIFALSKANEKSTLSNHVPSFPVAWFTFDSVLSGGPCSGLNFSSENQTVSADGWEHRVALGSVGFSRGVHYWEFTNVTAFRR